MKAYKEYMDNISVSDALHKRLVACAAKAGSPRRPRTVRRYAAVFACLAVIVLGAMTIPRFLQNNMAPAPEGKPFVSQPAPSDEEYTLVFNKAGSQISCTAIIPGHFWRELTAGEIQEVFPALPDTYAVTATANFQSEGTSAALFTIDAHAVSDDGRATYIQIAPGEAFVDYVLDGDIRTSNVLGTAVKAGYFETKPDSQGQQKVIYFASFDLSGLGYYVELGGAASESAVLRDEFSSLIGMLIKGGAADLSAFDNPAIPKLRNEVLDLNEAYADPDFGAYLPQDVPAGFGFESATRFINQESDYLSVLWTKGMDSIHWSVSRFTEDDKARLTSVSDTQNYDLRLYPIPRAESVPDKLREIVENPIFRVENLTLEAIQSRSYEVKDAGDTYGPRMHFSVLYGDVLVEVNVKGASPDDVYEMLQKIRKE